MLEIEGTAGFLWGLPLFPLLPPSVSPRCCTFWDPGSPQPPIAPGIHTLNFASSLWDKSRILDSLISQNEGKESGSQRTY